MKKSELYYLAQIAVISSACITPKNKLETLRVLMADEHFAKYTEEKEEKAVEE